LKALRKKLATGGRRGGGRKKKGGAKGGCNLNVIIHPQIPVNHRGRNPKDPEKKKSQLPKSGMKGGKKGMDPSSYGQSCENPERKQKEKAIGRMIV